MCHPRARAFLVHALKAKHTADSLKTTPETPQGPKRSPDKCEGVTRRLTRGWGVGGGGYVCLLCMCVWSSSKTQCQKSFKVLHVVTVCFIPCSPSHTGSTNFTGSTSTTTVRSVETSPTEDPKPSRGTLQ